MSSRSAKHNSVRRAQGEAGAFTDGHIGWKETEGTEGRNEKQEITKFRNIICILWQTINFLKMLSSHISLTKLFLSYC